MRREYYYARPLWWAVWDSVHVSFGGKGGVDFYPLKPHDDGPSRWAVLSTVGGRVPRFLPQFHYAKGTVSLVLVAINLSSVSRVLMILR